MSRPSFTMEIRAGWAAAQLHSEEAEEGPALFSAAIRPMMLFGIS